MGIFKKKEPRVVKDDDPLLIKLWYTPRSHGLIVLGAYLVFFLIIILLARTSSNIRNNTYNKVDTSSLFTELNDKKIKYNILFKKNNDILLYNLETSDENSLSGILTSNGEVSNVSIKDNECTITLDEEKKCPEDVNYSYFNYNEIYNLIKNKKAIHYNQNKLYKYDMGTGRTITLYYDDNKVLSKVEIDLGNYETYEINYSIVEEKVEEEI